MDLLPASALVALSANATRTKPRVNTSNHIVINGVTFGHETANGQFFDGTKPYAMMQAADNPTRFRMEIRDGDYSYLDTNHGLERSELNADVNSTPRANYGSDKWVAYSFRIEPGAPLQSVFHQFCIFGQWHSWNANRRSPIYNNYLRVGDEFVITTRCLVGGVVTDTDHWSSGAGFARDVWHSVVIQFHPDASGGGLGAVNVWMDGAQIVNVSGIEIGYSDETWAYWKFGAYAAETPDVIAVEYANMEISSSDLSARIAAPLALV